MNCDNWICTPVHYTNQICTPVHYTSQICTPVLYCTVQVVLRTLETGSQGGQGETEAGEYKFDVTHVNGLKDDIAMIQTR